MVYAYINQDLKKKKNFKSIKHALSIEFNVKFKFQII